MKKYIIAASVAGLFTFNACSDFLDTQPEGKPSTTTFFTNDQEAIDAIDGLYSRIAQEGMFGREIFWEQGATTDVVWGKTRGYPTLATLNYTGNESPLKDVFEYTYMHIARANFVIKKLLAKKNEQALTPIETRSLGEAYFVRGFLHFYAAYRYGTDKQGVPFVRYEDYAGEYDNAIPPQQPTVMDNYKLIIQDMDEAVKYLPRYEDYSDDDFGRAHQAAAIGYKAKTYAYWACWDKTQWQNVIEQVNLLEQSYGRQLAENYEDNFTSDFSKWRNDEYIYTLPSTGGDFGGGCEFGGVVLENKGWSIYNGWGQNKPSLDIYNELSKDDENLISANKGNIRKIRSILEYGQKFQFFGQERKFYSQADIESGFQINKFMEPFGHADATSEGYVNSNGNWPTCRLNFPVLRFADLLLLRAEAYLNTGNAQKAAADINTVRNRANVKSLDHTATSADIYHERRVELAFEFYDHLYDLKRWAHSGDATIKDLALKELNKHPDVRKYNDRSDPNSQFTVVPYEDYKIPAKNYQPKNIVFPYPSDVVKKSNGKLKQNEGY